MTIIAKLDLQFLNAIRVKPDCLPSVPASVVARLTEKGLLQNKQYRLRPIKATAPATEASA